MSGIPWVEKYRPKIVDDLTMDDTALNKIKRIIHSKEMPNLIITGPPGIGKTTTILCAARQLLGKHFSKGVLELNASDDRGIKAVQNIIPDFCKKRFVTGDEFANHKIVLLDEADNMTRKAQNHIRTILQEHHKTTRFAFTCNNSEKIIEPIQTQCLTLHYKPLTKKQIMKRLVHICKLENVPYQDDGLDAIIDASKGDMRQAINNLQLTFTSYKQVTIDDVYKICNRPHPITVKEMIMCCKNGQFKESLILLQTLKDAGYSSVDIVTEMRNVVKTLEEGELDEDRKIAFMENIGKTHIIISRGVDSHLQLTSCLVRLLGS